MGAMLKPMLLAVVLLVTYCLIRIYVGHGDAPAALVLVAGRAPEYLPAAIFGWIGICGLAVAALLARRQVGPSLLAGAVGVLLLSWVGLLWVTQNRGATLVTSVPFLLVAAWMLFRWQRARRPAQDSATSPGVGA